MTKHFEPEPTAAWRWREILERQVVRLGAEDRARRTKVGMTAPGSQADHHFALGGFESLVC